MINRDVNRPIGLFDSGIGGLSVARRITELLPHENVVYFGDTARVPYGSKSSETVRHYTSQAVRFLESRDVKRIVVACNTASAVALDVAEELASVPVVGVIDPGAEMAVEHSVSRRIGVIGTEGTVRSEAYRKAILEYQPDAAVFQQACSLFVALAEEGWTEHQATDLIVREYLRPLTAHAIDTLILGCTHYPVLESSIARVCGPHVTLVDPGLAAARALSESLAEWGDANASEEEPDYHYYLSDFPHKFIEVGSRFLGRSIDAVEHINVEQL